MDVIALLICLDDLPSFVVVGCLAFVPIPPKTLDIAS
jgi:hypothetical protein